MIRLAASAWTRLGALTASGILPYFLALLAAGLLPLKQHRRYLGVSLALALLWACLAWRASAVSSTPWWAAAAALESLVLVGMAVWGRLEFGVRSGPWATIGSAILIYALVVFPFLERYLEPETVQQPGFHLWLPVVLLTCGFLLFAREPASGAALIIPLSWALLGGPGDLAGASELVEQTELGVALLAGAAYLLQPPALRRGGNHLAPGARYDFAIRWRTIFTRSLWALALLTALLFFSYHARRVTLPRFTFNLALLTAFGILFWLAFTAWLSLWFRAVAWWTARALGRACAWLGQSWRWAILLLAAAALWAVLPFPTDGAASPVASRQRTTTAADAGARTAGSAVAPGSSPPPAASGSPAHRPPAPAPAANAPAQTSTPAAPPPGAETRSWRSVQPGRLTVQVFAAVALLWLAYLAYRGRKRLVIGRFVGCTGDEDLDRAVVAGVGLRLQNELARIAEVFTVIDEATPSQKSQLVQVTPGVQDIGAILKDASAITVGPVKISANLLTGLVGQLVSGPQLTGALHKVNGVLLLTADISGGGLSFNWQADAASLGDGRLPSKAIVQELVVQLAFRVATDLVATGSPSWRAVRAFTEGLHAYRKTQRRERDRFSLLRQAECCFIRALDEDQQFAQCHFNLGVVYRQLGEIKSAQSAFRRALQEDPNNFEACYALAEALATDEQHARARWFCGAAIAINPHDARAWDLKSFAARYSEQERRRLDLAQPPTAPRMRDLKLTLPHGDPAWGDVRRPGEVAVALAWRALCGRALSGSLTARERDQLTALTCTRNLAVTFARSAPCPDGRQLLHSLQLFRQAAWLSPHDSALQLYEGRTFFWSGAESALSSLRGIFADGLSAADQAMLWSVLAQADACFAHRVKCRRPMVWHADTRSVLSQVDALHAARAERRTLVRLAHARFLDVVAGASFEDLADIADLSLEEPPGNAPREKLEL
jgi:tetratricopeptide (TPR) repeat protein